METRKIKILAIDDNPDNLLSLKALIKESFPKALFSPATDGTTGLDLATTNDPDVILLDIVMPEMDGFEVCSKLKADKVLCDIPVVFITALKGDKRSRLQALEVGAEAFLAKPIDEHELTAQIRAMVKIKDANIEKRDRVKVLTKLVNQQTLELVESNNNYHNLCEELTKENKARKKSEETYRMLFESINDAVFISEKLDNGKISRFIRVNKVACERLGYTEQELLSKTSFDITSDRMKPLLPDILNDLFEKNRAILETEHATKDGRIIPVEISTNIFQLEGKTIFHSIARDITERKKSETSLKESENKYRSLVETAHELVWKCDANAQFTYLNPAWEHTHGYKIEKMLGKSFAAFQRPEIFERDIIEFTRHMAGGSVKEYETNHIAKDGRELTLLFNAIPLTDGDGNVIGTQGTAYDITERKLTEQKLKESEEKFSKTFFLSPVPAALSELKTSIFIDVNEAFTKLLGFEKNEIIGKTPFELGIFDKGHKDFVLKHKDINGNIYNLETTLIDKNGNTKHIIHSSEIITIDNKKHRYVVVNDITDRKKAEEKLKQSEARLIAAQSVAKIGSWETDLNNLDVIWSEETFRIFEIDPNDFQSTHPDFMKFVHPDDLAKVDAAFFESFAKQTINSIEHRIITSKGIEKFVEERWQIIYDDKGKPVRATGTCRDITDRKLTEEKMQESEEKFKAISNQASEGITIADMEGNYVFVNPAFCNMSGYSEVELLKKKVFDMVAKIKPQLYNSFFQNKPSQKNFITEITLSRKDGSDYHTEIVAKKIRIKNQDFALGIIRDITERKKREKAQSFSNELLRILNSNLSFKEMVNAVLYSIREEMKYSAVGMRIKIGDDFPYFAENGFSNGFLLKENSLLAKDAKGGICKDENGNLKLECTCGLVCSDKTDPANPLFTNAGSFWTNNSYPLLELTPEQDPRFQPRTTCIHLGYGSIAIIPIRANGIIIGTLQLNDKKENAFTIEIIHFFESISLNIGNTIMRNLEIEKRKMAEQELKEQADELVSRNTQLTDFTNIISHNLRGPLVNISMLVDFLEQCESQKEKDEIMGKFKSVISTLNENFAELIESLQVKNDLSIKKEKINVEDCFLKIMEGMQVEINKYKASIEMDFKEAPVVNFPKKYFKSILYNLFSNSLKYKSLEHNPVIYVKTVSINNTIVLSFKDNGLGIDLKRHNKDLFKIRRVFHEHPDAKGFGLFITKTQVEAMGGRIWVESTPGKGSTFFIEFKNQNM